MVLLDVLAKRAGISLIVAHFNHGIRPDSGQDEELVVSRARQLGKQFAVGYGHLGPDASEAIARQARYRFLEEVRRKHQAEAIITAHHQDDLIETAILNILRGTGPKGLSAISSNQKILRPLLGHSKQEVLDYAKSHNLKWQDDPTNPSDRYLRNYVRNRWLSNLSVSQKQNLISNIDKVAKTNELLSYHIAKLSQSIYKGDTVNRRQFIGLPVEVENELVAYWLRKLGASEYDRRTINRINVILRTSKPGTKHPVKAGLRIEVTPNTARFVHSL